MVKIRLYIEGGGDSALQSTQFRQGWRIFFENAGLEGRMPAIIRGGGREDTYQDFKTAVARRKSDELPLLLVDSEELVAENTTAWAHLKNRDGWDKPTESGNEDVYLMICCMETWFLADLESLRHHFGAEWRDNAVPAWTDLEAVPKGTIFDALNKATAGCGHRAYAKGKRSFKLLELIDPVQVDDKCPEAKRLLKRLRSI